MCTTCGCGHDEMKIEGVSVHAHEHIHADGTRHSHAHDHRGPHGHGDDHDHTHEHPGQEHHGHAQAAAQGVEQARLVRLEQAILAKNDRFAAANRARFAEAGVLALNLVSSPGAGKTSLLVKTIEKMRGRRPLAVIEGDQETRLDAERIRATGAPAIQINTGKGCHLDAHAVGHALDELPLSRGMVLFIENVGNLVCPAAFDLGEAAKVVILSVTEGEDKPFKYPDMFRAAKLMLINKVDLLPFVDFDVAAALSAARRVNPFLETIQISAKTGVGFEAWLSWIEKGAVAVGG
ncbi:MAG: hydrogenase nickel incorporation protein HypB [Rhodocyclaceae bacterium]|nr:hydrogenase nickel incorporation protein HypB [Rhodocyclaceae bacterium]